MAAWTMLLVDCAQRAWRWRCNMGLVYASTEVRNIHGGEEKYHMPFLVDTGATDSVISGNELDKIGVKREFKRTYELVDGSHLEFDVGYAMLCINGEHTIGPVIFAGDDTEPLLGITALESIGFIIDPVRQILKKTAIPLKIFTKPS